MFTFKGPTLKLKLKIWSNEFLVWILWHSCDLKKKQLVMITMVLNGKTYIFFQFWLFVFIVQCLLWLVWLWLHPFISWFKFCIYLSLHSIFVFPWLLPLRLWGKGWVYNDWFKTIFFWDLGVIIIKWAKNHVKRLKNYQFCQTYLCNATIMSTWLRKFVLNDLYECWRIVF